MPLLPNPLPAALTAKYERIAADLKAFSAIIRAPRADRAALAAKTLPADPEPLK